MPASHGLALKVLCDPSGSREVALEPHHKTMIGSASSAGVVLTGPGVAQAHARLEVSGDLASVLLEDLQSGTGTRVNGARVERAWLRAGDRIAIGDSSLELVTTATAPLANARAAHRRESWERRPAQDEQLSHAIGEAREMKRRAKVRVAYVLGVSLLFVPVLTLGGSWFTSRVRLAPGQVCAASGHLERARTPAGNHRFREAETELRVADRTPIVVKRGPGRLQGLIAAARREMAANEFDSACVLQKQVFAIDPKAGHALTLEIGTDVLQSAFHHSPPVVHTGAAADPKYRDAWPDAFKWFEQGDFERAEKAFDSASRSAANPGLRDDAHVLARNVQSCAHLLGNPSGRTARAAFNVCGIVDAQGAPMTRARALLAKRENASALESFAKGQTDDAQELLFAWDSHLTALDAEPKDPDAQAYLQTFEAAIPALLAGTREDSYRAKRTWMALALALPTSNPLRDRALEELARGCDR